LGRSAIVGTQGSLVDVRRTTCRVVVTRCSRRCPSSSASEIEDLICGAGPGREKKNRWHNIGPRGLDLSRLDVPGVTVNRYCSSSLMTTRIATMP